MRPFRGLASVLAVIVASSARASAASLIARPVRRGDHWPSVELHRDARDATGAVEGRIFLHQVTNPQRRFGPFLNAKEVGLVRFSSERPVAVVSLERAVHVTLAALAPGRYELTIRAYAADGDRALAEAIVTLDEQAIERLSRPDDRRVPRDGSVSRPATEGATASAADPKLASLDGRELARLPSDAARRTAQVFAYVLATRDVETFQQLVGERGLRTERGTRTHKELAQELRGGLDPLLGATPKSPWHVLFSRESPATFTMKPSATSPTAATFAKGDDGIWRLEGATRKKALGPTPKEE